MREKVQRLGLQGVDFDPVNLGLYFQEDVSIASVVEYFSKCVPVRDIDCEKARILGKQGILDENSAVMPGCLISALGFLSIAVSPCGDVFSLDCVTGKVWEISHEKYNKDSISPGWNSNYTDFLPDIPITRANVIETAEREFENVEKFLTWMDCLSD